MQINRDGKVWFWKSCHCLNSGVVEAFRDETTGDIYCVPERCPECGAKFRAKVGDERSPFNIVRGAARP